MSCGPYFFKFKNTLTRWNYGCLKRYCLTYPLTQVVVNSKKKKCEYLVPNLTLNYCCHSCSAPLVLSQGKMMKGVILI